MINIENAIQEWSEQESVIHTGGPFFMKLYCNGMVRFEVKPFDGALRLSLIEVPEDYRDRGLASKALDELARYADKYSVNITATVHTLDKKARSNAQLLEWYKRHGFVTRFGQKLNIIRYTDNPLTR